MIAGLAVEYTPQVRRCLLLSETLLVLEPEGASSANTEMQSIIEFHRGKNLRFYIASSQIG